VNPKELALASDQIPRLAKALKRDKNDIARRLTSNLDREFLYLARHMQPSEAQKIRALEIPGVYLMREYRRYYPAGEVAGHILGFTSVDDEGTGRARARVRSLARRRRRRETRDPGSLRKIVQNVEEIRAMRPGRNLVLSIDLRIQYLAYRELKAAIRDQRAKSGSVIVLDVATGEVLAMVNQPTYNPNDRDQINAKATATARSPTSSNRVRRSSRSWWPPGSRPAASTTTRLSTPTRVTSRSAPNYSRIPTTSARSASRPSWRRARTSA
jgi:cell division protein FtsI (penicillin-binding protein 3)